MTSSKAHLDLTEHQGPPSNEPVESPANGPKTLPYPLATPAPGQPSLPTIPKPVPATPSAQPAPFVLPPPPPPYNSVAPLPSLHGQTYSSFGQYPHGSQQPHGNMQQQQQVTTIIAGRPTPMYIRTHRSTNVDEATGAIVLSCFVFWCCGVVFGLVAFILAIIACNKTDSKKKSHRLSVASYVVSGVGIGVAILVIIIAVSVTSSSTKTSCSSSYYEAGGNCFQYRMSNTDLSSCSLFGGYFSSDSYCYFDSYYYEITACGQGYYSSATGTCYTYRSSAPTSGSCTNYGDYYTDGRYCYYS